MSTGLAGLLRIEPRRSTALWLAPVMVVLAWVSFRQQYSGSLGVAWSDRSLAVRDIAQPIWPLVAGAAAWMAGRRRRRGMAELLATTPYPAWWRELSTWAGTVTWGVLAYVLVASVIPAFRARLPELSRTINRIAAPLAGLPGAPDRFVDDNMVAGMSGPILGDPTSAAQEAQLRRDGLYVFSTPPRRTLVFDPEDSPAQIAFALVFLDSVKGPPTDAQEAIMMWLLRRAGFSPDLSPVNRLFFGLSYPAAPAAARRFGALSASAQRVWFRTPVSALRSGILSLSDLP